MCEDDDTRDVECNPITPAPAALPTVPSALTDGEKMIWAAAYAWNVAEFGADCAQAAHDTVVQARRDLANAGGDPLAMLRAMVGR